VTSKLSSCFVQWYLFGIRAAWKRRPLQLTLFGKLLAGKKFFQYLEECRAQGAARLQSLEVFHLCLLPGYRGKYLLERPEKLARSDCARRR
jgi:type VI secretion system protein ImpK